MYYTEETSTQRWNQWRKDEKNWRKMEKEKFANAAAASHVTGHKWRNQQGTSSRTSWWIVDPELRDELSDVPKRKNYREEADVTGYESRCVWWNRKIYDTDFWKMEAAEVGRTDEPKSLPHFSSCCFFLFVLALWCVAQKIWGFPVTFEFSEVVSATACAFFVPSFLIHVTARCHQQCSSCQKCKAQQQCQILFCRVMTPSLTLVRPGRWLTLVDLPWVCHCRCHCQVTDKFGVL